MHRSIYFRIEIETYTYIYISMDVDNKVTSIEPIVKRKIKKY